MMLAIDTALDAASACVWDTAEATPSAAETIRMSRGHAEALIPLIDRVVDQSGHSLQDIERVAVSIGPGSFTGVRIGIAAARAIGLAVEAEVVGVSSLTSFAAPFVGEPGMLIASAVDARHGRVFFQSYDWRGTPTAPPALLTVVEAVRLLGTGPVRFTGTGAPLLAIEAWSRGVQGQVSGDTVSLDIAFVAKLGMLADPVEDQPKPLYLKAPDVTPAPVPTP